MRTPDAEAEQQQKQITSEYINKNVIERILSSRNATMPMLNQQKQQQQHQQQLDNIAQIENSNLNQIEKMPSISTIHTQNAVQDISHRIHNIRQNVSRVLEMYFQNVTDEYGYGAASVPSTAIGNTTAAPFEDSALSSISYAADATEANYNTDYKNANNSFAEIQSIFSYDTKSIATTTAASTTQGNNFNIASNKLLQSVANYGESIRSINSSINGSTEQHHIENSSLINIKHLNVVAPLNTTVLSTSTPPSITYPSYAIRDLENCSASFTNYSQPQNGKLKILNNLKKNKNFAKLFPNPC